MVDYQGALEQARQAQNPWTQYAGWGPANQSQASKDLIEAQNAGKTGPYPGYTYDPKAQQWINDKTGKPMADGSGTPYEPGQLNESGQDVLYVKKAGDEMSHFKDRSLRRMAIALGLGVGGGLLSAAAAGGAGAGGAGNLSALGDVSEGYGISPEFLAGGAEAGAGAGGGALDALAAEAGVAPGTALTTALPEAANVAEFGVGPGVANSGGVLGALKGTVMNPDGSINWSKALETFGSATDPNQKDQGALGSLSGFFTNAEGMPAWGRIAGASLGALGAAYGMSKAGKQAAPPPLPASMTTPLTPLTFNRTMNKPTGDLTHYGESPAGEFKFFNDEYVPGHAGGGDVRGPGSGRDDKIDALLSDGEYVMDAETVAMLGDGSLDEGARRLDQMRQNLRKHKGKALAKGKFSPNAKAPEAYLPGGKAEGGPVNPQLGVRDLPPVNSSDPAPLPNSEGTYASDDLGTIAMMDPGAELKARLWLDKLQQSLGGQLTAREAEVFGKLNGPMPGHAKGGPIRPDLMMRSLTAPVAPRNARSKALHQLPLPPGNLDRLSGILDKSQPLDLSRLSPEDLEAYRAWLLGILNAPPQKAKGGPIDLTVIKGGTKLSLAERAARLEQLQRMIDAYTQAQDASAQERKRLGMTQGTDPYNQQPKPKLEVVKARGGLVEAQARVAAIQSKLKKAEGGPVKELSEFADKLEESLEEGHTDLAVGE